MEELLYEKEVICPLCNTKFKVENIRLSRLKLKSQDTDLKVEFVGLNPYLYSIWVCPKCFYASLSEDFSNLSSKDIQNLKNEEEERIALAKDTDFTQSRDEYLGLLSCRLAAWCYQRRRLCSEKVASVCLRASWIARSVKNKRLEEVFQKMALEYYKRAFEQEDNPNLDEYQTVYLLAEINRRLGNYEEAMKWLNWFFSRRREIEGKREDLLRFAEDIQLLIKKEREKQRKNK